MPTLNKTYLILSYLTEDPRVNFEKRFADRNMSGKSDNQAGGICTILPIVQKTIVPVSIIL